MLNIEQTIVELGTIFQQLAHMVKEQEEVVQRQLFSLPFYYLFVFVILFIIFNKYRYYKILNVRALFVEEFSQSKQKRVE